MSAELPVVGDGGEPQRAERCETCRFAGNLAPHDGIEINQCLRYPPVFDQHWVVETELKRRYSESEDKHDLANTSGPWIFPVVELNMWCGEWQPQPSQAATAGGGG